MVSCEFYPGLLRVRQREFGLGCLAGKMAMSHQAVALGVYLLAITHMEVIAVTYSRRRTRLPLAAS